MSTASELDALVSQEITRQLAGIDACYPDWDEATQIRYLRLFVERGTDQLAEVEDAHYAFMLDCVHLAGENMQDARLQFLEGEVAELKNPPVLLGDILLDGVIILAGELMVAAGAFYAAPALLSFLGGLSVSRAARKMTTAGEAAGEAADSLRALRQTAEELASRVQTLPGQMARAEKGLDWLGLRRQLRTATRDHAAARDRIVQLEAALETSEATARRAVAAHEAAQIGAQLKNAQLQDFLKNAIGHTIVGRAGETLGQDLDTVSAALVAQTTEARKPPFESSSLVGQLLMAIAVQRHAAREEWMDKRLHVRFLDDTRFLDSQLVQELFRRMHRARPQLSDIDAFTPSDRRFFVEGFEVLLWLHWLGYNNVLGVVPFTGLDDPKGLFSVGKILDGRLTKKSSLVEEVDGAHIRVDGDLYPGIPKLTDEQTQYLYFKFARGYFVANEKRMPAPFKFVTSRYDEVPQLAKTSYKVLLNADRLERLDEMRLMVIVYFMNLAKQGASGGQPAEGAGAQVRDLIRKLLGLEPHENPVQECYEGLPPFQAPQLPATDGDSDLAPAISSLLRDAGIEEKWLVADAQAALATAVTDLDLKISVYPPQRPSAIPGSAGTSPEDALAEIESMQAALQARYEAFLDLAAEQSDIVNQVQDAYEDRIAALISWLPESVAMASWHWPATDNTTTA